MASYFATRFKSGMKEVSFFEETLEAEEREGFASMLINHEVAVCSIRFSLKRLHGVC